MRPALYLRHSRHPANGGEEWREGVTVRPRTDGNAMPPQTSLTLLNLATGQGLSVLSTATPPVKALLSFGRKGGKKEL